METDTDALGRKALNDALRAAGVKPSHASELVHGKKTPSLDLALSLEETTGIPPMFWRDRHNRGAAMWLRIQEGLKRR